MNPPYQNPVIYEIDDADRVVSVNENWTAFAVANDAPELSAPAILGVRLWDAVTDRTTRELYRTLLERVRHGEVVTYPYRCDGPAVRRDMTMRVGLEGRRVRFTTWVHDAVARDPQTIFNRHERLGDNLIRACSWCKRIAVTVAGHGDRWENVEVAIPLLGLSSAITLPALTHGICPQCYKRVKATFVARPGVRPQ